jgi:hypothetical protein
MIKIMTGLDIVEKVMLSPAKAEKFGVSKKIVEKLVDRFYKGQNLVPGNAVNIADEVFGKGPPQ